MSHFSTIATLQHTATHCNTLQHTATYWNTLQHTAKHYNPWEHSATQGDIVISETLWKSPSRHILMFLWGVRMCRFRDMVTRLIVKEVIVHYLLWNASLTRTPYYLCDAYTLSAHSRQTSHAPQMNESCQRHRDMACSCVHSNTIVMRTLYPLVRTLYPLVHDERVMSHISRTLHPLYDVRRMSPVTHRYLCVTEVSRTRCVIFLIWICHGKCKKSHVTQLNEVGGQSQKVFACTAAWASYPFCKLIFMANIYEQMYTCECIC